MATTYLTRTSTTPTSTKIGTFSVWFKRSKLDSEQNIFNASLDTNDRGYIQLDDGTDGIIRIWAEASGVSVLDLKTDRLFRDTSGWYHLVVAWDTSQSVAANRVKMYINGVQETSFSTETYPTQDVTTMPWNISGYTVSLGSNFGGGGSFGNFYSGLMSYAAFIDGTQEAPAIFGETDSDTGEWKIKTTITPSSAWGNNGFFILKDGNSVTDQSGESNNLTVAAGTLTNTEDCPDDVFCTLNPLDNKWAASTFSNGNTTLLTISGNAAYNPSTFAVRKGKFYFEVKIDADSVGNAQEDLMIGISNQSPTASGTGGAIEAGDGFGIRGNGKMWAGSGETTGWPNIDVGDIVTIAVDFDNGYFYMGIDGVWGNSGDPTSGATGTGGYGFTVGDNDWFMGVNRRSTSATSTFSVNFGNGYFGTTAISSAGTNASDIGEFEFDVPTGYTALSTKGLNE